MSPGSTVRLSFEVREASDLQDDGAAARLEADLIRLNPDPLAPSGRFETAGPTPV